MVTENEKSRVLWTKRYKYVVYDHGESREMLIDLKNDPGEMKDLAADARLAKVLNRHRKLLRHWYRRNGETLDEKLIVEPSR